MTIDKQTIDTLVQLIYWLIALFVVVETVTAVVEEMGYKKGIAFILGVTVPITVLYYFVVEVGGFPPLLFSLIVITVATLVGLIYHLIHQHHRKKLVTNQD